MRIRKMILMGLVFVLCMLPAAMAQAATGTAPVSIDISKLSAANDDNAGQWSVQSQWKYVASSRTLQLYGDGGNYTLTGINPNLRVSVSSWLDPVTSAYPAVKVTLDGVALQSPPLDYYGLFAVGPNTPVQLTLVGTNTFIATDGTALGVANDASLTLKGSGTLSATGGTDANAVWLDSGASLHLADNTALTAVGVGVWGSGIYVNVITGNTINVGAGAKLDVTGRNAVGPGSLTLNSDGITTITGTNTSAGIYAQTGSTLRFGGSGQIIVEGSPGQMPIYMQTPTDMVMSGGVSLTLVKNTHIVDTYSFVRATTAGNYLWQLSGAATTSGLPTDAGITVSIPAGATGTISLKLPLHTAAHFALKATTVTYDGLPQSATVLAAGGATGTGKVTAVYYNGSTKAPVAVGTYKVTVDVADGTHFGTTKGLPVGTFTIAPISLTKVTISKVAVGSKRAKVTWKKVPDAEAVTGYRVRYRVKGTKTWKTKTFAASKASGVLKGLKKGKVYQVQVRSYKTVAGVNYYSAWSATKKSAKIR